MVSYENVFCALSELLRDRFHVEYFLGSFLVAVKVDGFI